MIRVRSLAYSGCDCFLVCFSLIDKTSFKNAITSWVNEVQTLGPRCPLILVGTKSDLRAEYEKMDNKKGLCVTTQEAMKAARENSFFSYLECSAKTQSNLHEIFFEAQNAVFKFREEKAKGNAKSS